MIVAYIAHQLSAPTREGIDENRRQAARWAAWACLQGLSPVCSWITLTGELDETPENRARGLAADCAQVERCDVVLQVGPVLSSGMTVETEHGSQHGVPKLDLIGLTMDGAAHVLEQWMREHSRRCDTMPAPADVEGKVAPC